MICPQSIPVLDICVPRPSNLRRQEVLDVPSPSSPIFREVIGLDPDTTAEPSLVESVLSCSDTAKNVVFESKTVEFVPKIRSGSYADIGSRPSMDDEHIRIDDLSTQLGPRVGSFLPSSFYGVFDGHGGPEAAAYVKKNAMKLFFEDAIMPDSDDIDDVFLQNLENSHRRAFLQADLFLADERSVDSLCGTTALTALVLGRILLVANAGDCRAVLCRKGKAIEMSQDHRSSCLPERKRVEELGGVFDEDGYLNGCLAVTRALGDWEMKPLGSQSPLIADPEIQRITLSRDDEFLIIGCDGIWDVMSNQHAVTLVRRGLRRHDDPQQCAKELAMEALRLNTSDNLTVIVVCFTTLNHNEPSSPRRSRLRCCSLSEESRNRLKRLLEGN